MVSEVIDAVMGTLKVCFMGSAGYLGKAPKARHGLLSNGQHLVSTKSRVLNDRGQVFKL